MKETTLNDNLRFFKQYVQKLPLTNQIIMMNVYKISLKNLRKKVNNFKKLIFVVEQKYRLELHVYLLINNIDGMNFRNANVQNVFKSAAQSKYIHILATIDHIHAPLSNYQNFPNKFPSSFVL